MTIETKIAKNGSTRYYVRDEETGKLTAISAAKVCELKRDNERQALEQKTNAYINGIFDEYEAANGVQHIDDKKTFRASLSATLDGYNSYGQQRYYATIDEAVNAVLFFNKNYYKFNNYANVEVNISRFDRVTYLTLGYNGNMTFSEEFFALKADDAAIEYAVTAEAMDIATEAEIENAHANDVKVTEQDNSNVTIDNGKIFDSAKVTIDQAVNIISRLNYRNDTFQYRFTTREDNADIQYRHFDAYRQNGDKDAFAISEIVINGKLEIVRFYNLFRDIIVDLHIGNLNYTLGYRGAIEIADEHSVNYNRFLIDIDVENTETGNCVTKSHFQSNACDAANWIINFAAKHHNRKIISAKIRDFKFSRMVYQFTDADINAINADPFVKTTRQADALKDKIARDAKASDDSNVFDLLPDVDELPDGEWTYWRGMHTQIKAVQHLRAARIAKKFADSILDGTEFTPPTVDDGVELVDEALPQPTGIYDDIINKPVTDKQERIEELADAINENSDAYHEADFLLTVAQRQGDTLRADELKTFMDGCIADAYLLNDALDALLKPPTNEPPRVPQVAAWQDPHQYGEHGNLEQPRDISIYCAGNNDEPPTDEPPADDFNSQLAELTAAAKAAHAAEKNAMHELDKACDTYHKAEETWRQARLHMRDAEFAVEQFLAGKAKELRDDLLDEDIFNANIAIIAQAGKCFDQPNLADIWIGATPDQKLLINSCTKFFATYDTPEQVRQAVNLLRDAINRGDSEFKFPTIGELNKPTTANEWRTVRTKTNPRNVNLTVQNKTRTNA